MLKNIKTQQFKSLCRQLSLNCIYFAGLSCTSVGVTIMVRSGFGVDAWNTVIVRLADLTPITLGTWTVLLQGSFWIITSVFNRKVEMDCILPIIWKGLSLDVAKAVIGARLFNNLTGMCFLWFLIGYAIMGISTGIYIATDYPRMPIDGMMLAIKQVFSLDIKKSSGMLCLYFPLVNGIIMITVTTK